MRRSRVSTSAELGKGTSLLMRNAGKRFPNDTNSESNAQGLSAELAEFETDIEKGLETYQYGVPDLEISPMPIDKVDDHIYIGNFIGAGEIEILKTYGITHIINTAQELPNFHPTSFEYINLGLLDDPEKKEDLTKILEPTYRYILNAITANKNAKILVHCHAGKSRSATIVIYYLMRRNLINYSQALQHLKTIRWLVEPNTWYSRVLQNVSEVTNSKKD
ncbi:MAG TPA: dual specificity protein phosphatase [Saprospiraceae bacterium]|nr:dual specificity protein phosphatase [Saprospiraceae bacterium]